MNQNSQLTQRKPSGDLPSPANVSLNGRTIVRFAHAYESGGGTERYLDDLDRALMERNETTIFRLHLTRQSPAGQPVEEACGRGRLVRVPLPIRPENNGSSGGRSPRARLRQALRDHLLYHPVIWKAFGARWAAALQLRPEAGQAIGAGPVVTSILRERPVDLVMLHFFGGADADEVAAAAAAACVPIALLNHFSNDRFLHLAIRKHAMVADGIAGVNGLQLPAYVRGRFTNVSDGIDTEFFHRRHARPLETPPKLPIILLPGRVIREKGQLDLVKAVASIRDSGIDCCIAFAGRVDSTGFVGEVRRNIDGMGLADRVHFLGELNLEELRDWYGASAVMAFPTYHQEGLPRVILEAKAMELPIVAYATGGIPEGIDEGKSGYLVPTGDVTRLAQRLRELLLSSELCSAMGKQGRLDTERSSTLIALAERHERFYRETIAAYRRKRLKEGNAPVSS